MTATTTIRIDEDLKRRIAVLAESAGTTPHALIVHTLESAVESAEAEEALNTLAERRWATLVQTGKSVPWDEARAYLEKRLVGQPAPRPRARALARKG